jgi:hypothetical protein
LVSKDNLILKISDENVNIGEFAEKVIIDSEIRDTVVYLMLNNPEIMVYYNSYYIISRASELKPELFYNYWDDFLQLLNHQNSYHRDFALILLANLTRVDTENKFSLIFDDYFSHINDEKFMTSRQCIQNTAKILTNKDELTEDITNILLDIDARCNFPEKQKALLKSDVIDLFEEFYEQINDKERINEFIKAELDSISPKTKRKAKNFVKTYSI